MDFVGVCSNFFVLTLLGFEKCRFQGWSQKSSPLLRTHGIGSSKGTLTVNSIGKQNSAENNCVNFINLKTVYLLLSPENVLLSWLP